VAQSACATPRVRPGPLSRLKPRFDLAKPFHEILEWVATELLEIMPVYVRRGQLDEANTLLAMPGLMTATHDPQAHTLTLVGKAELLRAEGKTAEAISVSREVVAARAGLGLTASQVKHGVVQLAEAAMDLNDLGTAEAALVVVESARRGEVTPWLRAQAARLSTRLASLRGEKDGTDLGLVTAEQEFRRLGTTFDLAVTLAQRADWLKDHDRTAEAEVLIKEATSIFSALGARPWLERLEAVRAGASGH
jgi:hypothetical protein